jgi:hypothetical protein
MTDVLRIFIGFDHRQPISLNVLASSIYARSSKPVAIVPLVLPQLPIKRQGLTPFTYSRFLVPYLCSYQGWALFLDLDMVVLDDISKLFDMADDKYAVMVSKNELKFERASMMLFNCAKCPMLTPEMIETHPNLHSIAWLPDELVGDLPRAWNHLVGYDTPCENPKLVHYTQGVPAFVETQDCEHADKWFLEHKRMNSVTNWVELMGNSVHAAQLPDGTRVPKYKAAKLVAECANAT